MNGQTDQASNYSSKVIRTSDPRIVDVAMDVASPPWCTLLDMNIHKLHGGPNTNRPCSLILKIRTAIVMTPVTVKASY